MTESTAVAASPEPRQRGRRLVLLVLVPVVLLAGAAVFYLQGGRYVTTDNAYVRADKVPVSSQVSGRVEQVLVVENQHVEAGQPLFRIDSAPFDISVAKARAHLAQVRADLAAMKASYRETQAQLALRKTRSAFSQKEERRQSQLLDKEYISAATFDNARQASDVAAQEVNVLEQELSRLTEMLGGSADAPAESHPSYQAAQAELEDALLNQQRTLVRASIAGVVSNLPKPGQYLSAGSMALALVASDTPWIEANFPETDLTHVQPGQSVEVRIDIYPDRVWQATVQSLSPATGSEFSVIPAQNATGNWVKIVQRVPVRIQLQTEAGAPSLLAGLSTEVEIDTGHRRQLSDLL
ncbi:membrane fusion protein, multidrug efflux system [Halopseudomonas sabulinigri]|uniref:Membrane fusion protein, multidrug efflux system n=1 Tax=Halopseudomonas sabulinigri TaxID=472181 RepID=A0A1H1MW38_9GAMM|nr:HlyD family secretion protein [Halopseudomonas sabulinigri]SDR90848.1 membrane fusion protein, multidrug efflux system [Halopseudomonas sabulinigri]